MVFVDRPLLIQLYPIIYSKVEIFQYIPLMVIRGLSFYGWFSYIPLVNSPPARWGLLDFISSVLLLRLLLAVQIPVGAAGPPPRAPDPSGHCRTSTASCRSQWALPDLNRELQIPVGTAGPQRPDRMPEDMPDRMPEDMSDRMPEDLPVRKCINVMVGITRSKVIYGWMGKWWLHIYIHRHQMLRHPMFRLYEEPDFWLRVLNMTNSIGCPKQWLTSS